MRFFKPSTEGKESFDGLLLNQLTGNVVTLKIGLTGRGKQCFCFLFRVHGVGWQEALLYRMTVTNDNGSENLYRATDVRQRCSHGYS